MRPRTKPPVPLSREESPLTEARFRELAEDRERISRHAAEVEQRNAELEESLQAMGNLLYTIAHDLRAPLRAMEGFTTALIEDYASAFDEVGKEYAGRIVSAAGCMNLLIRDLLVYGRLLQMEMPCGDVALAKAIEEVQAELAGPISEKKARIEVIEPLPAVRANSTVLKQVLHSLLSNALKFCASPPPRIRIQAETRDQVVHVTVSDNGLGIAPEHHERIFQVFQRLHSPEAYPGTGIGLAIVKGGIERMSGRVGVESQIGKGSCFWFELPHAGRRGADFPP